MNSTKCNAWLDYLKAREKSQPGGKKQNPSLNRTSDDKEVMLFVQKKKVLQRYYWETFAEDLINNNFGSTTFSQDLADNKLLCLSFIHFSIADRELQKYERDNQ